jgi:hypothetical protein
MCLKKIYIFIIIRIERKRGEERINRCQFTAGVKKSISPMPGASNFHIWAS